MSTVCLFTLKMSQVSNVKRHKHCLADCIFGCLEDNGVVTSLWFIHTSLLLHPSHNEVKQIPQPHLHPVSEAGAPLLHRAE